MLLETLYDVYKKADLIIEMMIGSITSILKHSTGTQFLFSKMCFMIAITLK